MDLWRLTFYMQNSFTDEGDVTLIIQEDEKYSIYRELTDDIRGGSFLLVSDVNGLEYLIPKDHIHHIIVLPNDVKKATDISAFVMRSANNVNGGISTE